jgi:uncharacterized protein
VHAAAVRFELFVPESRSLKAKRAVLRPIIDGLRHRMKISVAEVDHQDTWQRATIALACVSSSARHANEVIDKAMDYLEANVEGYVTGVHLEIL